MINNQEVCFALLCLAYDDKMCCDERGRVFLQASTPLRCRSSLNHSPLIIGHSDQLSRHEVFLQIHSPHITSPSFTTA